MTSIPMGYVTPSGWPPLQERILEAVVQGLTANVAIDQSRPEELASKAVEITKAVMSKVMGADTKLGFDHGSQQIVTQYDRP